MSRGLFLQLFAPSCRQRTAAQFVSAATCRGRRLLATAGKTSLREGARVSPWHGIPLSEDMAALSTVNFVCEIGLGTREKFEVAGTEPQNPIKQDVKKGRLRLYHTPSLVNYGMLPRTWESNVVARTYAGVDRPLLGDGDALDVLEIGDAAAATGDVYAVRVIGALALVDEGEIDWKIVAVRADGTTGAASQEIAARVARAREWFRTYKLPDGKPPNVYAMGGALLPVADTLAVIRGCHAEYNDLVRGAAQARAHYWLPPQRNDG